MEGFPSNTDEVEYLLQQQLFPDLVLIMEANIMEVHKRLLPSYLDEWRKWQRHLEEQIIVLRQLRQKNRVGETLHSTSLTVSGRVASSALTFQEEKMAKRRAEMMAEFEAKVCTTRPREQTANENEI